MKRSRLVLAFVLVVLAAAAGLVAWLGPSEVAWSAKALAAGPSAPAWDAVPASSTIVVAAQVPSLFAAPITRKLRPRLERLAASRGLDLGQLEREVKYVVATPRHAVVSGAYLSPGMLPVVDHRWSRVDIAGHAGVTDGESTLVPLAPGRVLATLASEAAPAMALLDEAARGAAEPLPVGLDGVALAARVTPDQAMRLQLMRRLPAQAAFVATAVRTARIMVTPGEDVKGELVVEAVDEEQATQLQALFMQVDGAAKMAKSAGPLAAVVLGKDLVAILADVPSLDIARDGSRVTVKATASADELDRWVGRAEAALGLAPAR